MKDKMLNGKDYKHTAFVAAGRVKDLEIMFAIFPALKFKVDSIRKRLKTLSTTLSCEMIMKFIFSFV
jgi:hypothetical protein